MAHCIVTVKKVEDYSYEKVEKALFDQMSALGYDDLSLEGKKVVIKPNLLTGKEPAFAITTNPAVVRAMAVWLRNHGAQHIALADSSGGVYTAQRMKSIYTKCGLTDIPEVELNYDMGFKTLTFKEGKICKSFNIINPVAEADFIVNIGKLKTHAMTTFTAGVKNLFGCVPGLQKPEMHYTYPEKKKFCGMLIDLAQLVAPQITVIDAIDAMEGDGPSGGTVRHFGYLFCSDNIFAQDLVAVRAMGIDEDSTDFIRLYKERGLIPENIEVWGDEIVSERPFTLPKTQSVIFADRIPAAVREPVIRLAKKALRTTPKIIKEKCIGCGRCAESCPAHTITVVDRKAKINYKNCISCFCCQEMCPAHAIKASHKFKF